MNMFPYQNNSFLLNEYEWNTVLYLLYQEKKMCLFVLVNFQTAGPFLTIFNGKLLTLLRIS